MRGRSCGGRYPHACCPLPCARGRWAVFHYSGAAAVVGQSYLGALLCSADGTWPADAVSGPQYERIVAAFRTCGIEMWELCECTRARGAPTPLSLCPQHARQLATPPASLS
eukprot:601337-Prymnesium_polylepis.2